MRYVGLIDCNNFFVSCERLFRPDLERVPVIVLSSNDGCVVARSNEIKDMGIPMGVPYFQIKDIIKDTGTICFSSHFALYRDISSRVFSVVREHFEVVEQYSIDEAFFSFEATSPTAAQVLIESLKRAVEQRIGVPVTVGVSNSKTRAKLVGSYAKRRTGTAVCIDDDFLGLFAEQELRSVWGVGGRLARRYSEAGITTIADLLLMQKSRLQTLFGVGGVRLQAELAGIVALPVSTEIALPKSIMSTRSFAKKTNALSSISDALAHHIRSVTEDVRRQQLLITHCTVLLYTARHGDYALRGGALSLQLPLPSADTTYCLKLALEALKELYEPQVPYAKVGFVATQLIPQAYVSASLWGTEGGNTNNTSVIDDVLDSLNTRFGRDTVRIGQFTKNAGWQTKQTLLSPAYTTSWSDLRNVRTG